MKVGLDCHHIEDQRGIRTYVLRLLKEWKNLNYLKNNEVICYVKEELPDCETIRELASVHIVPSKSTLAFQHVRLPSQARRDNIDVLFSPSYILPFAYRRPSVVTIHDIIFSALPEEFDWPGTLDKHYIPRASYWSAKTASFVLVPSRFTKEEIVKHWDIREDKIIVIPLAGNIGQRPIPPLFLQRKTVLFVGNIFNRRNVLNLITTIGQMAKKRKDVELIIVGKDKTNPPQHIEKAVQDINERHKRNVIIQKDWVANDELARLYKAATVVALLSRYEGFGLPILEAMSTGTPVLTTGYGSLPEIAGDAALYIKDPDSIHEIESALTSIIDDSVLQKTLASKGKKQAQRFSWTLTAKRTWDILHASTKTS